MGNPPLFAPRGLVFAAPRRRTGGLPWAAALTAKTAGIADPFPGPSSPCHCAPVTDVSGAAIHFLCLFLLLKTQNSNLKTVLPLLFFSQITKIFLDFTKKLYYIIKADK
jgi:hypothetical protein